MAFVPVERASVGSEIEIDIRGKSAKARQVLLPFYRRPKPQS
jgi:glycine cleavage system aminomethyltransferase T